MYVADANGVPRKGITKMIKTEVWENMANALNESGIPKTKRTAGQIKKKKETLFSNAKRKVIFLINLYVFQWGTGTFLFRTIS